MHRLSRIIKDGTCSSLLDCSFCYSVNPNKKECIRDKEPYIFAKLQLRKYKIKLLNEV
jgi:hypothetical protein